MALTEDDISGLEADVEEVPASGPTVTVSELPPTLVKLLEAHAPAALDRKDKDIILRMPVGVDEPEPLPEDADKNARILHREAVDTYVKALDEAEKKVKRLCGYATSWGKGQKPQLWVHKIMNRQGMPRNHARLRVETLSKVTKLPGRPTSG